MPPDEVQRKIEAAANRLHHFSMYYAGELSALVHGDKAKGVLPTGHPGLKTMRDLVDLVLFTRAEINAITAILIRSRTCTEEALGKQIAHEYDHLSKAKGEQFGIESTDLGLKFTSPDPNRN